MNSAQAPEEPTYPSPPRYRWLKRIIVAALAAGVVLAGLGAGYVKLANGRLGALAEGIRARGEPLAAQDFQTRPIPDSENAAVSLRSAVEWLDMAAAPPAAPDVQNPLLRRNIVTPAALGQKAARALVRFARQQPGAEWTHATGNSPTLYLPQMNLANLVLAGVVDDDNAFDLAESVEIIRDVLRMADAAEAMGSGFSEHLVASGMRGQAIVKAHEIDLRLQVRPESTTIDDGLPTRAQIRDLIADLLHEQTYTDGLVRAFAFERGSILQAEKSGTGVANGMSLGQIRSSSPVTPMARLDASRIVEAYSEVIADFKNNKPHPTVRDALPPRPPMRTLIGRFVHDFQALTHRSFARHVEGHYRILVEGRAEAIRLGIAWYRLDHHGALPASLEELVPEYLPYSPADPFAPAGPFRYRQSPSPIIYSVGSNDVDDGAPDLVDLRAWGVDQIFLLVNPTVSDP
jgi:hypothetical protein